MKHLRRVYRIAATGFSFAVFGIFGIVLTFIALPLMKRLPGDTRSRELRAQRLIHHGFRLFRDLMAGLGLIAVRVRGGERLREARGVVIVSNHPTLIDVVLLVSLLPEVDCVVKREAWDNRFHRGAVTATGYVPNDQGETLLEACSQRLRQGRSLLLFPEGTRSPKGGLGPLQRGAAHVALRSGRPILPVFIVCDPPSLMRDQPWWDVPERRMQFSIEVGEPLEPKRLLDDSEPRGAAARRITGALRDFYEKRLQTVSP